MVSLAVVSLLWSHARARDARLWVLLGIVAVLLGVAADIGLAAERVHAALASDDYRALLAKHWEEAQELGVIGVPTFVLPTSEGFSSMEYVRQISAPSFGLRATTEPRKLQQG